MSELLSNKHARLQVRLDRDVPCYAPGQQVRGRVVLVATKDISIGALTARFIGRTATKVISATGQLESQFDNREHFVDLSEALYQGHYTHKAGEFTWPFVFEIPSCTTNSGSRASIPATLPPSTWFSDSVVGRDWSATVEYLIEADLISPSGKKQTATAPIQVRAGGPIAPPDLSDPNERTGVAQEITIRSWMLLPDSQHAKPQSFRQRTASLFNSASLPKFTFEVDVSHPQTLQVRDTQSIPFTIGVTPLTASDKTDIVPSAVAFYRYPSITILSVRIDLHSTTTIRYPTMVGEATLSKETRVPMLSIHKLDHRLIVRSTASDQKTEAPESCASSVDVGKLCNLRLVVSPANSKTKHSTQNLTPTLHSTNITHKHALSWTIKLSCAGQKHLLQSSDPQPITVLDGPENDESSVDYPDRSHAAPPIGPVPAYSKSPIGDSGAHGHQHHHHQQRQRHGLGNGDGQGNSSPPAFHSSEPRARNVMVQQVMRDAKAAAEIAMGELPAYTEAEGGTASSPASSSASSASLLRHGNRKPKTKRVNL